MQLGVRTDCSGCIFSNHRQDLALPLILTCAVSSAIFFRMKAAICVIYTKLIDFPNEVVPSKISSEGITTVLSEILNACNYSIVGKLITGFNRFSAASFPASKHNSEIPRSKNFS